MRLTRCRVVLECLLVARRRPLVEALVAKWCQVVTETFAQFLLLFEGIVEVWHRHLVDDGTLVHPVGLVHVLTEYSLTLS